MNSAPTKFYSWLANIVILAMFLMPGSVVNAQDEQLLVYDNIFNTNGNFFSLGTEFGDEISLGGTAREFEKFELEYFGKFTTSGDEKAVIRFYKNDGDEVGPGAVAPGTLLYQSPAIGVRNGRNAFVLEAGSTGALSELVLPNTFTWTIEISGIDLGTEQFGIMLSNPVHIGSSFKDFWALNTETDDFGPKLFADGTAANFSQRVYASGGIAGTPNLPTIEIKPFVFKLMNYDPATKSWHIFADGTEKTRFVIETSTNLKDWDTLFGYTLKNKAENFFFNMDFGSDIVFFRAVYNNPKLEEFNIDRTNLESGVVTLDITGDPGLKVRIEWTEDLLTWRPLLNVVVNAAKKTYDHILPEEVTQAFYRVIVVP